MASWLRFRRLALPEPEVVKEQTPASDHDDDDVAQLAARLRALVGATRRRVGQQEQGAALSLWRRRVSRGLALADDTGGH
jgi:hypothetical protein